jgi:hypothetical protein
VGIPCPAPGVTMLRRGRPQAASVTRSPHGTPGRPSGGRPPPPGVDVASVVGRGRGRPRGDGGKVAGTRHRTEEPRLGSPSWNRYKRYSTAEPTGSPSPWSKPTKPGSPAAERTATQPAGPWNKSWWKWLDGSTSPRRMPGIWSGTPSMMRRRGVGRGGDRPGMWGAGKHRRPDDPAKGTGRR